MIDLTPFNKSAFIVLCTAHLIISYVPNKTKQLEKRMTKRGKVLCLKVQLSCCFVAYFRQNISQIRVTNCFKTYNEFAYSISSISTSLPSRVAQHKNPICTSKHVNALLTRKFFQMEWSRLLIVRLLLGLVASLEQSFDDCAKKTFFY